MSSLYSSGPGDFSTAESVNLSDINERKEQLEEANRKWREVKAEIIRQKQKTSAPDHRVTGEAPYFPILNSSKLPSFQLSAIQRYIGCVLKTIDMSQFPSRKRITVTDALAMVLLQIITLLKDR
jgi:hypothetical protein